MHPAGPPAARRVLGPSPAACTAAGPPAGEAAGACRGPPPTQTAARGTLAARRRAAPLQRGKPKSQFQTLGKHSAPPRSAHAPAPAPAPPPPPARPSGPGTAGTAGGDGGGRRRGRGAAARPAAGPRGVLRSGGAAGERGPRGDRTPRPPSAHRGPSPRQPRPVPRTGTRLGQSGGRPACQPPNQDAVGRGQRGFTTSRPVLREAEGEGGRGAEAAARAHWPLGDAPAGGLPPFPASPAAPAPAQLRAARPLCSRSPRGAAARRQRAGTGRLAGNAPGRIPARHARSFSLASGGGCSRPARPALRAAARCPGDAPPTSGRSARPGADRADRARRPRLCPPVSASGAPHAPPACAEAPCPPAPGSEGPAAGPGVCGT